MNYKHIAIGILIGFLLLPGIGFSQEKLTLTLEKSVSISLEKNPNLKMAEKQVAKAGTGVGEAYSAILPQLDATANLRHSWAIQTNRIPNFIKDMLGDLAPADMPDFVDISFGLENTFSYGATILQPLYLGGAGIAGIRSASAARKMSEQNLEATRQDLIYQTVDAFYSCLLAKELVEVQSEALEQSRANLSVVEKKYNVGMASGFDKMRAEVEVANWQPEVITAKNNYQMALTQLRTVLGLDNNVEIEVSGEFNYVEDDFSHIELQELQDMALTNHPEFMAVNEQKKIAKSGITLARSEFLPKLYFQTDYSFLAMKNDLKFSRSDFSKGFNSAISLQIPLFHGFRSTNQYQKAKLDYKIMLDTEKQVSDGITAEVELAYNKLEEAKETYLSANKTIEMAREALRLANLMYEEGANTQLDVINSQLALTQARLNYARSLYEYQIARYQLRRVTGNLKGILK